MRIEGGVFIVTGGASGLGAATARMLLEEGGHVALIDINEMGASSTSELVARGATYLRADVSDESSAERAVALAAEMGDIRGLVNCAGVAPAERVLQNGEAHPLAGFERTLRVNLTGTFNMIRLVAKRMAGNAPVEDGERGVIVSTASIAAFEGQVGQAAYSASKGGVVAMTLPIARELARYGIRNMTIAPGTMETPMLLGMRPEVQASLCAAVPFPSRMGKPDEFARLVQHIVGNTYLNGEVIRLDGALRMAPR
ncbi:MAG: SDR family NAD(P)-dependent oxidoreductase [Rubrivivax sp.]|nr:SDR family NAD(P)-dependent oxidoreductase [Rubrivivax sp.]